MIAFLLLAPLIFFSGIMSMFAGMASMLAMAFAFVTGPLIGALVIASTALLGAMIFILS
jgi:hypothetical protein